MFIEMKYESIELRAKVNYFMRVFLEDCKEEIRQYRNLDLERFYEFVDDQSFSHYDVEIYYKADKYDAVVFINDNFVATVNCVTEIFGRNNE